MGIKEKTKRISEYFKEMQVVTVDGVQMIYVIVNFPNGWTIDKMTEEKFSTIVEIGNAPNEYYFFTEIDNEDKIFDAIEYNIKKMKDTIERTNLFKQKSDELKKIFQNENYTIQDLKTLEFKLITSELEKIENLKAEINTAFNSKEIDTFQESNINCIEAKNDVNNPIYTKDKKKNK